MDFSGLITPELELAVKTMAIVVNIVHIFISLVLFNFIRTVNRQVKTPSEGIFLFMGIVHVALIVAILLMIIFLF